LKGKKIEFEKLIIVACLYRVFLNKCRNGKLLIPHENKKNMHIFFSALQFLRIRVLNFYYFVDFSLHLTTLEKLAF